jgi:hypothetical protein
MLNIQGEIKFSEYAVLYDMLIPKDNKYRLIDELIDFSFIYDELKDKYSLDNGRKAADPIMLFKYLMIKVIDNFSDVDVVEHSRYDLSYKRFLGLMPEDDVIDPSLLTKFRRQRLKDVKLLDILISKTVGIAIEQGIIKSKSIIVDATHTISKANPISPIDVLKNRSRTLRNRIKDWDEKYNDHLPLANHKDNIQDELKASQELMDFVSSDSKLSCNPALKEDINYLAEAIDDVRSHKAISHDHEARIGHKSAETSFLGYKTHIAMSPERIITAATITTGEKSDGKQLPTLLKKTEDNGLEIDTIIGDAAYSGKDNLIMAKEKDIAVVAKLNEMITKGHVVKRSPLDDQFTYNKDADRYTCPLGILSAKGCDRKDNKGPNLNRTIIYRWSHRKCSICKMRRECIGESNRKLINIRIMSEEHKEQMAFQNTQEFRLLSKERYKIEAKNAELKNAHGYDRADSYGLSAMEMQGAVTLFVVNLKRIMKLID